MFISTSWIRRLVFDRETGKPKGYGFCEFEGKCFAQLVKGPKCTLTSSILCILLRSRDSSLGSTKSE